MKKVFLSGKRGKGRYALIDDGDFNLISKRSWLFSSNGYAIAGTSMSDKGKTVSIRFYMHRIIAQAQEGEQVDHINRDRLDNRKSNLRICSQSINSFNAKIRNNNTSGYPGIFFNKIRSKWATQICRDGIRHCGGYYDKMEDAVKSRKNLERRYFPEVCNYWSYCKTGGELGDNYYEET